MQLHLATLGIDSLLYSVLYGGYSFGLAVLACKSNASLKIHSPDNTHGDWRSNSILILRALQISKIPAHSSTPIHHHHFCMHYSNQGVMSVEQSHLIIRLKKASAILINYDSNPKFQRQLSATPDKLNNESFPIFKMK